MNLNFEMIMVLAVLITGIIWALDHFLWKPKRTTAVNQLRAASTKTDEEEIKKIEKEPVLVEYARSFFPVILVVLLLRAFLIEPFRIPSGSMLPTLLVGDFILVNKYTYGLRLPVIHNKLVEMGSPERGDVVVFRYPEDPSVDYIKRVVGLPGDKVTYRNKLLYINGNKVVTTKQDNHRGTETGLPISGVFRYEEKLGNMTHDILLENFSKSRGDGEFIVPDGHYFVMGDNRDNSNDSRFWGTVPEENLVGKAFMIWMHWNFDEENIEWNRIGKSIE